MSQGSAGLQMRAQKKRRLIARKRRDPRFLRTMGKLVYAKLITTNIEGLKPFSGDVNIKDALWAGKIEPRIFELLPAILLKKPGLFTNTSPLPQDLQDILRFIRKGEATEPFRDVPVSDYLPWVRIIGHKDKLPTLLKSFRLRQDDLTRLRELKEKFLTTETEVIRRALRVLARE